MEKDNKDTGSSEAQIGFLTQKIGKLSKHLKSFKLIETAFVKF